jgi:hypothetical protein
LRLDFDVPGGVDRNETTGLETREPGRYPEHLLVVVSPSSTPWAPQKSERSPREDGPAERRGESGSVTPRKIGFCFVMKLYVGNLPYSTTETDLRDLFGQYGQVESVAIITDRETGRSKGFGFVEFASDDEARSAISGLAGQEYGGRALTVNEARPKPAGAGRGGRY